MSDENKHEFDDETLAIMRRYCGRDPREPGQIEVTTLNECEERWSIEAFRFVFEAAVAAIPAEYRATAMVAIEGDEYRRLTISYWRPENGAEIAERVKQAYKHAVQEMARERETYARLKRKFEGDA